jgi:hypothetical protein
MTMKLRFDKNSVRFRLRKSDLEKLREKNLIEETIRFPNGNFSFRLSISGQSNEVTAAIHAAMMEVNVPPAIAIPWMNNDEAGIYKTLCFGNQHVLEIMIEKDFPCKDNAAEDKSDTFSELAQINHANGC